MNFSKHLEHSKEPFFLYVFPFQNPSGILINVAISNMQTNYWNEFRKCDVHFIFIFQPDFELIHIPICLWLRIKLKCMMSDQRFCCAFGCVRTMQCLLKINGYVEANATEALNRMVIVNEVNRLKLHWLLKLENFRLKMHFSLKCSLYIRNVMVWHNIHFCPNTIFGHFTIGHPFSLTHAFLTFLFETINVSTFQTIHSFSVSSASSNKRSCNIDSDKTFCLSNKMNVWFECNLAAVCQFHC